MKQHSVCLICGSPSLKNLSMYAKHGLVKCRNCSFIFCKEIPSTETLIKHYGTYPRNEYISPITLKRYNNLSSSFMHYRQTGNWLDNGCGNGHLLVVAKENGWNVYGTEFTEDAVDICKKKGIIMHSGVLNSFDFPAGHFDVITFIEVIEHINNPHEEILKFSRLLHPGGILYVTTPNFNSISRNLLRQNWEIIEYPEHLCYYTISTIDRLLKIHGFEKISLTTTGFSPSRFGKVLKQTTASAKENEESIRELSENNFLFNIAKSMINQLLNLSRKGDTIKALYRKL